MTGNYSQRLKDYKKGKTRFTKNRGEFTSRIIEKCETREKAREREKYWKSGCGKEELKRKYYSGVEQSGLPAGRQVARVAHFLNDRQATAKSFAIFRAIYI